MIGGDDIVSSEYHRYEKPCEIGSKGIFNTGGIGFSRGVEHRRAEQSIVYG